jgi:tryptophan-rich sensory protein
MTLNKPIFNPPNWVFAPVWSALYIMMGVSAGWVWAKGFHHKWVKTGLYHFGFQLLLNGLWSIVFFGLKQPFYGLLVIMALLVVLSLTIKWFNVVSKFAAILLIPYLLWVCFATALNYKIWELN